MNRSGERGNVAVVVALSLMVLLGFAALVIDVGNFWRVRGELQNAADAAALAGVRDLNGQSSQFTLARLSAQRIAALHAADSTRVSLDLNLSNTASGDIVLGHWNFSARSFTVADGLMPPYKVNAVQVSTRRAARDGNPVHTFLAPLFGHSTQDIDTLAIAVGGSPGATCGFPLAVTDCSILGSDGAIRCNQRLTFGQATSDTVGSPCSPAATPPRPR